MKKRRMIVGALRAMALGRQREGVPPRPVAPPAGRMGAMAKIGDWTSGARHYVGVPAVMVFVGLLLAAVAALSGWPGVVPFVGAAMAAAGGLLAATRQAKTEGELRKKSDEIADLNRKIAASVTGGDSFCYVAFVLGDGSKDQGTLTAVNHGQYPLYDVQTRIVDLEKFGLIKDNLTRERLAQAETLIAVGNLAPKSAASLREWVLPKAEKQSYNIFVNARNGFTAQLTRLRRVNGRWKSATKVMRVGDSGETESAPLYVNVDPEFPRDEAGEVQWTEL